MKQGSDMTINLNISPIANQEDDLVPDRERRNSVFGLAVHTTGGGILDKAKKDGVKVDNPDLIRYIIKYYAQAGYSCHYIIHYDGKIYQVTHDDRRVSHIGVDAAERVKYLSGEWITKVPKTPLLLWQKTWLGKWSPQVLFPNHFPNDDYVGAEMPILATPRANGLRYTDDQHHSVARLAIDLWRRHGWPRETLVQASKDSRALPCGRLLGHEDLDAFGRWQATGGWDPGALRPRPWFSWPLVRFFLQLELANQTLAT